MTGLGAMMAGGNPAEARQKRDFYPTPKEVTWALLEHETFSGSIWEPMCGNWAMAGELEQAGYKVLGSDIEPLGPRGLKVDFLQTTPGPDTIGINLVTNPPFELAVEIIEHAMKFEVEKLCLVLKSGFWHAKNRFQLFQKHTPARIYPLLWRPDFLGKGRPTMECMWCVWDRLHKGEPVYRPMMKPLKHPTASLSKAAI